MEFDGIRFGATRHRARILGDQLHHTLLSDLLALSLMREKKWNSVREDMLLQLPFTLPLVKFVSFFSC